MPRAFTEIVPSVRALSGLEVDCLLEAVARVTVSEINLLRAEHSLPARTEAQVITAIREKYQDVLSGEA